MSAFDPKRTLYCSMAKSSGWWIIGTSTAGRTCAAPKGSTALNVTNQRVAAEEFAPVSLFSIRV